MLMNLKFEGPDDVFFGSPQIAAAQHAIVNTLISAEPHRAQACTNGFIRRRRLGFRAWPGT
jgi:hypothetical protein